MQPYRSSLGLGLVLALAACNPLSSLGNKPVSDYKLNPHPKQRYNITMTIANAPGSFASVDSTMLYDVVNTECLPPPDSNPQGSGNHMTRPVPFEMNRVTDTEYTGSVYTDFLLDEDYYGRGLCRWKLFNVGMKLRATGADGETVFIPGLPDEDLLAGKAVTTYFWKGDYPRDTEIGIDNFASFGQTDRSKMASDLTENELFSITLTPKEVQP